MHSFVYDILYILDITINGVWRVQKISSSE